jgi:hypothetical protein
MYTKFVQTKEKRKIEHNLFSCKDKVYTPPPPPPPRGGAPLTYEAKSKKAFHP